MARAPRSLFVAAQWLLAAAILYFVIDDLAGDWDSVAIQLRTGKFGWACIALSGAIFLATYALLIETWRRVVAVWGEALPWNAAARIWLVSNLGKYVPGKIWTITAMGLMAHREGISPVAATGSAIVMQLLSITSGVIVIALTGAAVFQMYKVLFAAVGLGLIVAVIFGPALLRGAIGIVARLTGKSLGTVPDLPLPTILIATAGTGLAWLAYGVAFYVFAVGLLGDYATGGVISHIAMYAASYIGGLVFILVPGGLGVREVMLKETLVSIDYSATSAALLAIASRIWLTLLEVVPGLVYYFSRTGSRSRT